MKEPNILSPILLLNFEDDTPLDELDIAKTLQYRSELTQCIPGCIAWIYRYWKPYRQAVLERTVTTQALRDGVKVGRNDPCPCGSGKKFKKCCGAAVLH
jgi:uncharacterized protein